MDQHSVGPISLIIGGSKRLVEIHCKDAIMSKRNELLASFKDQIAEWEKDLEKLEDRIEHNLEDAQDELQVRYKEVLSDLKTKQRSAIDKAKELEEASEEAWDDIKSGLDMAWDSLKLGFLAARSEFEDTDKTE